MNASDAHFRPAILSGDTSAEIERRQVEAWRRMAPGEKLEQVGRLRETVLALARAGIRQRHHGIGERECFLRLMALTLGADVARAAYPEVSELDPPAS